MRKNVYDGSVCPALGKVVAVVLTLDSVQNKVSQLYFLWIYFELALLYSVNLASSWIILFVVCCLGSFLALTIKYCSTYLFYLLIILLLNGNGQIIVAAGLKTGLIGDTTCGDDGSFVFNAVFIIQFNINQVILCDDWYLTLIRSFKW